MTKSQATTKAELLQEAEKLIEELLDWQIAHPHSDFGEMETFILHLRKRFGQRVAEALPEIQEERQPVSAPPCPGCGQKLRNKGQPALTFVSLLGELTVRRGYYYCETCQRGYHPLDEQLHLPDNHWSEGVVRQILWLNGHTQTYEETAELLSTLTDADISKSSGWRRVQTWGAKLGLELAAEEQAIKAQARTWSTPGGPVAEAGRMGVAVDGGMLCILKEGWKEFKAGCVFDVALETRRAPPSGDLEEYGHAVNLSYTVHLGGPEPCGWQIWTEAQRRDWRYARDGIVVGDGAPWIWNLRDEHFPYSETVVDWYHAVEHLGTAKGWLYGEEKPAAATRWYNAQELALYQGHAERVAHELELAATRCPEHAADLRRAAHYFKVNQPRMQYQRLREDGWPIGSGMVESGVKRFKARFDGAGMRWSRPGAENLLPVRAAVLSGKARFDELWQRVRAV